LSDQFKTYLCHPHSFSFLTAVYGSNFCKPVLEFDESLSELSARRLLPPVLGDDASDLEIKFVQWLENLVGVLQDKGVAGTAPNSHKIRVGHRREKPKFVEAGINPNLLPPVSGGCISDDDDDDGGEEEEDRINMNYITMDEGDQGGNGSLGGCGSGDGGHEIDLEDLTSRGKSASSPATEREMVTKLQRKSLTKEGYKIIGSHSAVKLCRWTKNQMRGRGGCYKHSFYGIERLLLIRLHIEMMMKFLS